MTNNVKQSLGNHRLTLVALFSAMLLLLLANVFWGAIKSNPELDWLDIVGEGGSALLVLIWLLMILNSRPSGMVTKLLSIGLAGILLSSLQDSLDEIVALPASAVWESWVESIFMPVGMIVFTIGLYFWHKEQQLLSFKWQKRERVFRDHRQLDNLVTLANASYLRDQLHYELENPAGPDTSLLMLDLNQFNHHSRQLGIKASDHLLQTVAELLLINLRSSDLLCRYAGDRFAILLPDTSAKDSKLIALALQTALANCTFRDSNDRAIQLTATVCDVTATESDTAEAIIARANCQLIKQKASGNHKQQKVA